MRFKNLVPWAGLEFSHVAGAVVDIPPAIGAARVIAGLMEPAERSAEAAVSRARAEILAAESAEVRAARVAAQTEAADLAEQEAVAAETAAAEARARADAARAALAEPAGE